VSVTQKGTGAATVNAHGREGERRVTECNQNRGGQVRSDADEKPKFSNQTNDETRDRNEGGARLEIRDKTVRSKGQVGRRDDGMEKE
jgi:hypothetical protein